MIEVAAGLVFRDGRLLLTQRRVGDHLGGLWEFPGGKRHQDETFQACLRRELREELGVDVIVGGRVEALIHHYEDRSVHIQFFLCALPAGDPRPIGCQDLAWVTHDELAKYEFPAADARLIGWLLSSPALWQAG